MKTLEAASLEESNLPLFFAYFPVQLHPQQQLDGQSVDSHVQSEGPAGKLQRGETSTRDAVRSDREDDACMCS